MKFQKVGDRVTNKPGVMIYFDIVPSLKRMTPAQISDLFMAILEYGQYAVVPSFDDAVLDVIWPQIQNHLDADNKRYEEKCKKAAASVNARWQKEKEVNAVTTDIDISDIDTNVYERIQTNTFNTNYNSTTKSTSTTTQLQRNTKENTKEQNTDYSIADIEHSDNYENTLESVKNMLKCSEDTAKAFMVWLATEKITDLDKVLKSILKENGEPKYSEEDMRFLFDDALENKRKKLDTYRIDLKIKC